ncbi:unnamed protein product [Medioppia subpectinata]|uniref:Uncharacterized protein n=1 Tax=Medioppia subpectinata TaxID=1979941 RepID=A0A7R9L4B2_9ACAR|nr:unnamed protein product [Medioppia subpectinata]CAG2115314.1 unnamed protein product [Medioppia subpectinata]
MVNNILRDLQLDSCCDTVVHINQHIMTGHLRNVSNISNTRKSFAQIRDQINEIDSQISIVHLFNTGIAIYGCLVQIYAIMDRQVSTIFSITFVTNMENILRFAINCIIHGMVNKKAIKVLSSLDDIELQTAHKDVYREAIYFSSLKQDNTFGFTIANIFSFSTTLLTCKSI